MKKLSLKKLTGKYDLKPNQILVYTALLKITKKHKYYQKGYKFLSKKLNLDSMAILNTVKALEKKNLVIVDRNVGHKLRITAIEGDVYADR